MKTVKIIALVAALSLTPAALAQSVQGEKLDNGLGRLDITYTGWEFMPAGRLLGESLDNGLGKLGADYTGWEFMPADRVLGESLDHGLGRLTREDLEPYMGRAPTLRTAVRR